MEVKKLLKIQVNALIERDIINLDLSDATKNRLKRQIRKSFLDEDFIYDLERCARNEI